MGKSYRYMRIAIVSKNGKIAPMDEGENARIFEDSLESKIIELDRFEEYPGLQKIMDLLKKDSSIDAIITERCGPPCITLASSRGKKIYFYSGDIQDVFMKLLEGELKPATEDDALKFHGMHRNKQHHH